MPIASINPATGEKLKEFSPFDDAEIERRLNRAENASRKYRQTAFGQRSELMEATAELLLLEKDRLAGIITLEGLAAAHADLAPAFRAVFIAAAICLAIAFCSLLAVEERPLHGPLRQSE